MKQYQINIMDKQFEIKEYPGEKGTILAIHGLTGNHKNLHYYAETLSGEYRFISIDLRGRGNSSPMDDSPSIFKHASDVIQIINALNIEDPILIGHSMGAYISALVGSMDPRVKGIILLDGGGKADETQRDQIKPSLSRLSKDYESPEDYVEETKVIYSKLGIQWNPELEENARYEVKEQNGMWKHKSDPKLIAEDFESFYDYEPKSVCSKVDCDTLLVVADGKIGEKPPLFNEKSYEDTCKYTKKIETVTTPSNHYTMVFKNQPEINQQIQQFLSKLK
ncbi:alpha/beta hydrolase [Fictibacillus nanhaiensis]|uniref:alpha/beta fold hydrolase n=1 Tax=Fictibacillus nanhaiensis TaxID=742169 RepID=UPI00203A53AA|nr:alpha/beta hydrolase [Fictibacillus nanhaiensis]MCM3733835.1 alpha/beta hydrolase [Fictibacillus nanhaiensis]